MSLILIYAQSLSVLMVILLSSRLQYHSELWWAHWELLHCKKEQLTLVVPDKQRTINILRKWQWKMENRKHTMYKEGSGTRKCSDCSQCLWDEKGCSGISVCWVLIVPSKLPYFQCILTQSIGHNSHFKTSAIFITSLWLSFERETVCHWWFQSSISTRGNKRTCTVAKNA